MGNCTLKNIFLLKWQWAVCTRKCLELVPIMGQILNDQPYSWHIDFCRGHLDWVAWHQFAFTYIFTSVWNLLLNITRNFQAIFLLYIGIYFRDKNYSTKTELIFTCICKLNGFERGIIIFVINKPKSNVVRT